MDERELETVLDVLLQPAEDESGERASLWTLSMGAE